MAENLFNPSMIYQALQQRGMLPRYVDIRPEQGVGLFKELTNLVATKNPQTTLAPGVQQERRDNLAHEMTHAAQKNLLEPVYNEIKRKISSKEKVSDQEKQFVAALDKLYFDSGSRKDLTDRLYSPGMDRYEDNYRTKKEELQAFGVGYMSRPDDRMLREQMNINPHLNPTMASEFDILLTMLNKLPTSVLNRAAQERKQEIDTFRKSAKKDELLNMSVDLFNDPFAPTIR